MIIAKLIGGLGNQMFQYAAGFYLARKYSVPLKMDICFLLDKSRRYYKHTHRDYGLDIFLISAEIASYDEIKCFVYPRKGNKYIYHFIRRFYREKMVYKEDQLEDFCGFYGIPNPAYIEGFWQDYQYFPEIDKDLRKEFSFRDKLPDTHLHIAEQIRSKQSVCVVVRRGDYVGHPTLDIVDMSFYEKAFDILSSKIPGISFFIFSDDIDWCRQNMRYRENEKIFFVDEKYTGPKAQYYLQLMGFCNHFVIPNSTYAWWGAWLSCSPEKIVIAPGIWYKGQGVKRNSILPEEWIAL